MALRPYEDIVGPLVIPVRGKEYTLPTVSLQDGLRIHASKSGGAPLTADELNTILLGDAYQQLMDDQVGGDVMDRIWLAAYTDFTMGRDSAEEAWETGIPKATREAAREILATMTPTDEATTTPPPASGNGTTAPKKPATRSRGNKSSPTSP
jgi:hypothetical protein